MDTAEDMDPADKVAVDTVAVHTVAEDTVVVDTVAEDTVAADTAVEEDNQPGHTVVGVPHSHLGSVKSKQKSCWKLKIRTPQTQ